MIDSPRPRLVVADDDPDVLRMLLSEFSHAGYHVQTAADADDFRSTILGSSVDAVLLDLNFGKERGLDILQDLQKACFVAPVIIFTAHGSIEAAVEAMRLGAHDFITKPCNFDQLRRTLDRAIAHRQSLRETASVLDPLDLDPGELPMLGVSRPMQTLKRVIAGAAPSNATVFVLGESGTGKELVAKAIHRQSRRSDGAFVPVNMAALPATLAEAMLFGHEKGSFTGADMQRRGWCEEADGGTLFLDEIGEMDFALQAKLLRFLQERQIQPVGSRAAKSVDVRIIAATNRDPLSLIREGRLREDLYYRLNVIPIEVPPLRERRDDIPLLALYFLRRSAAENNKPGVTLARETLSALEASDWPGNVRQLENLIVRLVILTAGSQIGPEMLPADLRARSSGLETPQTADVQPVDDLKVIQRLEKQAILDALANCQGNVVQAGLLLGMGQATIYRKIKRYNIALRRPRAASAGKSVS